MPPKMVILLHSRNVEKSRNRTKAHQEYDPSSTLYSQTTSRHSNRFSYSVYYILPFSNQEDRYKWSRVSQQNTQLAAEGLGAYLPSSAKMMGFGMSRKATQVRMHDHSRVRVHSPSAHYMKNASFIDKSELLNEIDGHSLSAYLPESDGGNRVMVVIDSRAEAKGALEWALSHTVQRQDTIILLNVVKPDGKANAKVDKRAYDLLQSMKNTCQLKRPEVHVEMLVQEGKDKGQTIVNEAKQLKASLLVLGQRKQSLLRRLQMIWQSKRNRSRVVEYCIHNANCMTIAVRRKNPRYGGYLITTKRHKKFWLLA